MDKGAIKSFAIKSRRQMIESVKYQANLIGITSEGISDPISKAEGMETYDYGAGTYTIYDEDIQKRKNLVNEINNNDFENVVEEVAYTWFNRIIAIRFMEVNDYLPTRTRVLSSEIEGKREPDIITEALDLDLDYTLEDKELIIKLKEDNKLDELFQFLFIKQCNKLNEILPGLFEKTNDYFELLLNISFIDENGIIRQLLDAISEEDFGTQIEIIGWLYQFYNSELKDETFDNLKKHKIKITKDRIPAVTQLFTPNWIVRYMVENSVGRLWLEGHVNDELKSKWKYYLESPNQDLDVQSKLLKIYGESKSIKLEDIKIIDPCMGSGHILVYVFELLIDIYISEGYTTNDAVVSILENNLFGLDIDKRACQLSYFAVLMKAREYNRNILNQRIFPHVYSIEESNNLSEFLIDKLISQDESIESDLKYIINLFYNAKEYGCILNVERRNFNKLLSVIQSSYNDVFYNSQINLLKNLVIQAELLSQKYDVVVTNPPYMGNRGMNSNLREFIQTNYSISKMDLFAVFLEKGLTMVKPNGFNAMVTMQSWMFLSTFEDLRNKLINSSTIFNLLHMDNMVMGIAFGTAATIFRNTQLINYRSMFNHVTLKDIDENNVPIEFPVSKNKNNVISLNTLKKIPGHPISYWVSEKFISNFSKGIGIDDISDFTGSQNKTANNKKYLRYFWEVDYTKLGNKWITYAKGGNYRKYYGNLEYVVDWSEDARDFYKNNKTSNLLKEEYWYKEGITYTSTSSKGTGFRYLPINSLFDMKGPSIVNISNLMYIMGFLNSKVASFYLKALAPTIDIQVHNIKELPIIIDSSVQKEIELLTEENMNISKWDWDNQETSLGFKKNPLIKPNISLSDSFKDYENEVTNNFINIKENEERINKIFINLYDLNEDVDYSVDLKEITLNKSDYKKDIKSFISYVVGCMFGRYSLDNDGIIFAGGDFNIANYTKFIPDDDNIIPVLDTEYFEDDIVGRFIEFVKICFGEKYLEENLNFIAGALKKNGKTNREIIRNYFLNDFYDDHVKLFKKCPIFWQFDSGDSNAFKCLVYMHRYEPDLVARVRTDYLHKTQKAIEQNLAYCENIINNSSNNSEVSEAIDNKSKYIKQLDEIKVYDEALGHMATQHIEIDLDDGVKVNYSKFQNVEISREGERIKKINLLKKI